MFDGTLQSAVPEAALSTLIFEHLEEPVPIFSRKVGQGGSSTFEAAEVISISKHLVVAMLIYSREVGQQGSTFEAAQIFPSSENLKEPLLTFSREVGLVGSFTRQGQAVGGLWAVVQAAAAVAFVQWWLRCWARAWQHAGCLRRAGWAGGVSGSG